MPVRKGSFGKFTFEYSGEPSAVAWSADRRVLAVGSSLRVISWSGYTMQRVKGLNRVVLNDAEKLRSLSLTDTPRSPIYDLSFLVLSGAVNGKRVALGTIDKSILLYEWA